ncbi:MAG: hypothetical protein QXU47_06715 [Candidatus Bathyarchaeia archaeon]
MNITRREYLSLTEVLAEMLKEEGNSGLPYEPKGGRCGVCAKPVIADLHIAHKFVDGVFTEPVLMCFQCLEKQYREIYSPEQAGLDDSFLSYFTEGRKRQAKMDVERAELKRKYTPRKTLDLMGFEIGSTIVVLPEEERRLREMAKILQKVFKNPVKIGEFSSLGRYFYSKYIVGRELGLKLPELERTELILTGALYTALWRRPEYTPIIAGEYELKRFYRVLPRLLGYGIFPFESIFIRPSEVLRISYWGVNRTGIYLEALFWTSRILRKFTVLNGDNMKSIVVSAFFRELLWLQKRKFKGLPFKFYLKSFLDEISLGMPLNRMQIWKCLRELDWLKDYKAPFPDEYRKALGLRDRRRDEAEYEFLRD